MHFEPPTKVKSFKYSPRKIEAPPTKPRATLRDGVEVCGSEVAAAEAIERQLVIMRPEMDCAQIKAAETAAENLRRGHDLEGPVEGPWKVTGNSAEILAPFLGKTITYRKRTMGGSYPGFIEITSEERDSLISAGFFINAPSPLN